VGEVYSDRRGENERHCPKNYAEGMRELHDLRKERR